MSESTGVDHKFVAGLKADIANFDFDLKKPFKQSLDLDDKRRIVTGQQIEVGVLGGEPEQRPQYSKPKEVTFGEDAKIIAKECNLDLGKPEDVTHLMFLLKSLSNF